MAKLHRQAMERTYPVGAIAYQDRRTPSSGEGRVGVASIPLAERLAPDARGVVFSHSRRAPGRPVRLVLVEINPYRPRPDVFFSPGTPIPDDYLWMLQARVIKPATLFSQGGEIWSQRLRSIGGITDPPFGLQVMGGQIDPKDESHFTIGFNGKIIDGWLLPDDTVSLGLRLELK